MKKVFIFLGIVLVVLGAYSLYFRSLLKKIKFDFKILEYSLGNEDLDNAFSQFIGLIANTKDVELELFINAPFSYKLKDVKIKAFYKGKLVFEQRNKKGFNVDLVKDETFQTIQNFLIYPSDESIALISHYFQGHDVVIELQVSAFSYGYRMPFTKEITINKNQDI